MTDNTAGTVVFADAIKFVPDPTATAEIIIDNGGTESSFTGTWSSNTWTGGGIFWGANYTRHLAPQDTGATFTWTPTLASNGRYRVFARWSAAGGYASNARYTVHHNGGSTAIIVNQRQNGGQWNSLGEFDLTTASSHRVVVDDTAADGTVIADSVRFVRIGDSRRVVADAIKIVPNDAEDALYVHADHLGTPQKVTDATAAIVWDAAMTPFGTENAITGTETNNSRFPGQYYDTETGLHYNWHRYYEPRTGRYITADPIGLAGGLNVYGYVGGNPVGFIDPDGQLLQVGFGALLGGIAGGVGAFVQGGSLGEVLAGAGAGAVVGAAIGLVPTLAPSLLGTGLLGSGVFGSAAGVGGSLLGQKVESELLGIPDDCFELNIPAALGAGLGGGATGLLFKGAGFIAGGSLSIEQSISLGFGSAFREGLLSGAAGNIFGPEPKCGCPE